jgi:integrase
VLVPRGFLAETIYFFKVSMKLSQFFEQVYVPTYLANDDERTIRSYRESVKKVETILDDPTIYEVNLYGIEFVQKLKENGLQPATIAKHCSQLNSIFLKLGPPGSRNRNAKKLLDYAPYFPLPKVREKSPRVFTDDNFRSLFDAFNSETDFPKYLPPEKRPLFWQAIMIFVSITALRREVVLGIEWQDINQQGLSLHVRPEIDKKDKNRNKPIKPELIEYLELIRLPHVNWNSCNKIFQWNHGNKQWYRCWNNAEEKAGVEMGLHDLKRFSGDLAIRAGASDLELMAHMDHASLDITLKYYCRPKTRNLVNKIIVPIPDNDQEPEPPTPPEPEKLPNDQEPEPPTPSEPEKLPEVCIAPAFQFNSKNEIVQFYLNETKRVENSAIRVRTSGGTVLTILEPDEEILDNNTNNSTG